MRGLHAEVRKQHSEAQVALRREQQALFAEFRKEMHAVGQKARTRGAELKKEFEGHMRKVRAEFTRRVQKMLAEEQQMSRQARDKVTEDQQQEESKEKSDDDIVPPEDKKAMGTGSPQAPPSELFSMLFDF